MNFIQFRDISIPLCQHSGTTTVYVSLGWDGWEPYDPNVAKNIRLVNVIAYTILILIILMRMSVERRSFSPGIAK